MSQTSNLIRVKTKAMRARSTIMWSSMWMTASLEIQESSKIRMRISLAGPKTWRKPLRLRPRISLQNLPWINLSTIIRGKHKSRVSKIPEASTWTVIRTKILSRVIVCFLMVKCSQLQSQRCLTTINMWIIPKSFRRTITVYILKPNHQLWAWNKLHKFMIRQFCSSQNSSREKQAMLRTLQLMAYRRGVPSKVISHICFLRIRVHQQETLCS